jgi:hypothetical protein
MLYLFHGDRIRAVDGANAFLKELVKRRPDVAVIEKTAEEMAAEGIDAMASQGLFSRESVYMIDMKEVKAEVLNTCAEFAADMKASPHIFLLIATNPAKKALETFTQQATKVYTYETAAAAPKPTLDPFALANAYERGTPTERMITLTKLLRAGAEPEALTGMLQWKIKSLRERQDTAKLADRHASLIELYHESRREGIPLELALERWLIAA